MERKKLVTKHGGKEYSFELRETPYTGKDDLMVEDRKHIYLRMVGAKVLDESIIRKARFMATCELVITSGLDYKRDDLDMSGMARANAVSNLPPDVINEIVDEYFNQFEMEEDDGKKS